MKKLKSLYELDILGLNTPEILHYQGPEPTEIDQVKLSHVLQVIQRHNGRISVRTEKEGEFKSPFLPNALVPDVRKFLSNINGYHILLCKGLPTTSVVRGNCVPTLHTNYFEYLTGGGTVRDIDEGGRTPKNLTLVWGQHPSQLGTVIGSALQMVNSYLYPRRMDLNGRIVEFTVFSKGVGVKQDKVIFWEVREYGGPPRV